ncbi:MAG: hypothetical protein ACI37U_04430, partial [Bacteroides sp.]
LFFYPAGVKLADFIYICSRKAMCRKDLIGSKVFLDILFSGFVPFLSRLTKSGERQKSEVIDKELVTRG